MKKIVSLFMAVILLMSLSLCAFAVDLADGIYEVPVVLMHKEDEEESFGNKYVAQTGLLEIENGKKTITILLTTNMNGIEFSYYTDGSLAGDVAKGTPVSDITVAGDTYEQGFEIPVMADGDIGLQFSVPVMPMSPSARLRIDYSNAVLISAADVKEEPQEQTTAAEPATQTSVAETTVAETTVAETTVATATEATTVAVTSAVSTTQMVAAEATAVSIPEETEKEENTGAAFLFVLLFIVGTAGMTLLLLGDSKEKAI